MGDRFHKNYTPLTDAQKQLGKEIKEKAEELERLIETAKTNENGYFPHADHRCLETALSALETSIMWAVKGVFTGESQ